MQHIDAIPATPMNHDRTDTLSTATPRGGRTVLLLFLFFVAPLIAVIMMYSTGIHPSGSSKGEMLPTPRALALPDGLHDADGRVLPQALLNDKWSLVYIAQSCETECASRLDLMRRLQVSMDKDMGRLQRILIAQTAPWEHLYLQYPDLIRLPDKDAAHGFTSQFALPNATPGAQGRIYLVDPLGNLIMSYPEQIAPADIRKDLARLLAYAWAG